MFLYTDRYRNLHVLEYRQTQKSSRSFIQPRISSCSCTQRHRNLHVLVYRHSNLYVLIYRHKSLHVLLYRQAQKSSYSCIQRNLHVLVYTHTHTHTEVCTRSCIEPRISSCSCTQRYRNLHVLLYRHRNLHVLVYTHKGNFTFFYTAMDIFRFLYTETQKSSRPCIQADTKEHNDVQCFLKNTGLKLFRTGLLCDSLWRFIRLSCKCLWKPQSASTRSCSNQCHISGQSVLPFRLTL